VPNQTIDATRNGCVNCIGLEGSVSEFQFAVLACVAVALLENRSGKMSFLVCMNISIYPFQMTLSRLRIRCVGTIGRTPLTMPSIILEMSHSLLNE